MYFNTSFFLTEFCPPKYNQTQVNDCRIESINITTEIKDTSLEFFLCLLQPCNKQEIQKYGSLYFDSLWIRLLLVTFFPRSKWYVFPWWASNAIIRLRRLPLFESCPNIKASSWFQHVKCFTYLSPPYLATMRLNLLRSRNDTNCEKTYWSWCICYHI